MFYTIKLLMEGDHTIITAYEKAAEKWNEIMRQPEAANVEEFSRLISVKQFWFESHCDDPALGREIMAVTALARYYKPIIGFSSSMNKARYIYQGIKSSKCSDDLKVCLDRVAKFLGLID
ncbi:MAG: hypothetical protein ABIG46_05320 [Candidatus Omnitrophota bacterium]